MKIWQTTVRIADLYPEDDIVLNRPFDIVEDVQLDTDMIEAFETHKAIIDEFTDNDEIDFEVTLLETDEYETEYCGKCIRTVIEGTSEECITQVTIETLIKNI